MNITDLIEELNSKEIEVYFSAGRLKFRGPEGNVTPELLHNLKTNKGKLIKYFWPEEFSNLMPINTEGTKTPIFLVHGDNGNYLLSSHLGPDQPVYGFFHPGSEGEDIHYKDVREMAGAYLKMLLSVCPEGPYFLAGFSFGGVLAFEMALQLQKAGKKIPFLVLIDSISPFAVEPVKWNSNLYRIIRSNLLRPIKMAMIRYFKILMCKCYIILKKPIPSERRNYYMLNKYRNLTQKYVPGKFKGDILLFRTVDNNSSYKFLGWDNLVNNIKLVPLEADHTTIFENERSAEVLKKEFTKYHNKVSVEITNQS
jgi:aspartate racemase